MCLTIAYIISIFSCLSYAAPSQKSCIFNGKEYPILRSFALDDCSRRCKFTAGCKLHCNSLCPMYDELTCPPGTKLFPVSAAHYLNQKCFCVELHCKKSA